MRPRQSQPEIDVCAMGLVPYERALQLQKELHARCVAEPHRAVVLLLEHPPVITVGHNAGREDLLVNEAALARDGITLVATDRGGKLTVHEPGQLVMYPILHLPQWGLMPRPYVETLERAVIKLLESHGLQSRGDTEFPGVWIGDKKVCAIGVRIRQRVTMHGLALNVCNSLATFSRIVPCGIADRGVTTMACEANRSFDVDAVGEQLALILVEILGGKARIKKVGEVGCQSAANLL